MGFGEPGHGGTEVLRGVAGPVDGGVRHDGGDLSPAVPGNEGTGTTVVSQFGGDALQAAITGRVSIVVVVQLEVVDVDHCQRQGPSGGSGPVPFGVEYLFKTTSIGQAGEWV